ncbi:MAG: hypothetical protein A3F73_07105 [Gallionellales bacterium RIFCSPLOWO2_12_FULL_59_22]|nr:MAG: hypothetical protein A2Z65_07110 [Gallionellales bacterium RIFCSPLOWO2_02_58_13]OGT14163.1 MAG: hypothetical protein A3F73_07105 [Gallionellales bacterium RIFCSPLOWO2_12_FULL_59_22]
MLIQNVGNTAATHTAATPAGLAGNGGSPAVAAQAPRAAVEQRAAQQPQQPTHAQLSTAQLSTEIEKINSVLRQNNKDVELSISVDEATRKQIVKLTDKETGDTLIQYPSDAVLAIARGIDEFQQSFLLNQKA